MKNSNFKIMEEVVDNYEKGWSDRTACFEDRPEIMINLMSHVFLKNENINEKINWRIFRELLRVL